MSNGDLPPGMFWSNGDAFGWYVRPPVGFIIETSDMAATTRGHESMARDLRAAGWRVEPPLTQDACKHPHATGTGRVSAAGGAYSWTCPDCGKSGGQEWKSPSHLIASRWS